MTNLPPPPDQRSGGPDPDPIEVWRTARATLLAQAIDVLTAAVRLTRPHLQGDPAEPDDFGEFLAQTLASVAANVGSVHRLTAGRPGSWESDLLHQLVTATVGDDLDDLIAHRTEPVVVPLNVAQLVDDEGPDAVPPVPDLWDAVDTASPLPQGIDAVLTEAEWEAVEAAHDEIEARLRRRYHTAYADYANRFTRAVDEAARAIPGLTNTDPATGRPALRLPVEVTVEADPDTSTGSIDNPTEWDDALVWRLWSSARRRLGLPRP